MLYKHAQNAAVAYDHNIFTAVSFVMFFKSFHDPLFNFFVAFTLITSSFVDIRIPEFFPGFNMGNSLRLTMIFFDELRIDHDFSAGRFRDDLCGFFCPGKGRGDNEADVTAFQCFGELFSLFTPRFIQGNILVAEMPPFFIPVGFSVPNQKPF